MKLAFTIVTETNDVFMVQTEGDDESHCEGLAYSLVSNYTSSSVYDSCLYPVNDSLEGDFLIRVLWANGGITQ